MDQSQSIVSMVGLRIIHELSGVRSILAGRRSGVLGSRANACLRSSAHRNILDPDRFEAPLGNAKRHRSSFRIASPGQQRAIGADLFQQPSADELIHGLPNRFARNVCRQVKSAIIASRSRGQNDELGIGES